MTYLPGDTMQPGSHVSSACQLFMYLQDAYLMTSAELTELLTKEGIVLVEVLLLWTENKVTSPLVQVHGGTLPEGSSQPGHGSLLFPVCPLDQV